MYIDAGDRGFWGIKEERGYPGSKGVRGPPGMKGKNGVCEMWHTYY